MRLFRLCLVVASLFAGKAVADTPWLPADPGSTEVFLWTVGLGPEIYMMGGHTLLVVRDKPSGRSAVVDWGIFDGSDPAFLKKYILGTLPYHFSLESPGDKLAYYRDYEHRVIDEDRLNLTPLQTGRLLDELKWWTDPSHQDYIYNLWTKNCTTLVRDTLARAIGPAFAQSFAEPAGVSYRDVGAPYFYPFPGVALLSDILLGGYISQPISRWQRIFLPVEARALLREAPAFSDDGAPIPGTKLLIDSRRIVDGPEYKPGGPQVGLYVAALFAAMGALGFFLLRRSAKGGRLAMAVLTATWGIYSGAFACLMIFMWAATRHEVTYWNAGLFLMWPVDLALPALVPAWFAKAGGLRLRLIDWLARLHLAVAAVALVLWATGAIAKDLTWSVCLVAPSALFVVGACRRLGREKPVAPAAPVERPKRARASA